jgi:hypothetical protein
MTVLPTEDRLSKKSRGESLPPPGLLRQAGWGIYAQPGTLHLSRQHALQWSGQVTRCGLCREAGGAGGGHVRCTAAGPPRVVVHAIDLSRAMMARLRARAVAALRVGPSGEGRRLSGGKDSHLCALQMVWSEPSKLLEQHLKPI